MCAPWAGGTRRAERALRKCADWFGSYSCTKYSADDNGALTVSPVGRAPAGADRPRWVCDRAAAAKDAHGDGQPHAHCGGVSAVGVVHSPRGRRIRKRNVRLLA